jgi:hypothetical protein
LRHEYPKILDVFEDLCLIWSNCKTYNNGPGNQVWKRLSNTLDSFTRTQFSQSFPGIKLPTVATLKKRGDKVTTRLPRSPLASRKRAVPKYIVVVKSEVKEKEDEREAKGVDKDEQKKKKRKKNTGDDGEDDAWYHPKQILEIRPRALGKGISDGTILEYLILWKGYSKKDTTWETAANFSHDPTFPVPLLLCCLQRINTERRC